MWSRPSLSPPHAQIWCIFSSRVTSEKSTVCWRPTYVSWCHSKSVILYDLGHMYFVSMVDIAYLLIVQKRCDPRLYTHLVRTSRVQPCMLEEKWNCSVSRISNDQAWDLWGQVCVNEGEILHFPSWKRKFAPWFTQTWTHKSQVWLWIRLVVMLPCECSPN